MALTVDTLREQKRRAKANPTALVPSPIRVLQTEDGRLVPEGDPDGCWLFCGVGSEISQANLARVEHPEGARPPETKEATVETKERTGETKSPPEKPRKGGKKAPDKAGAKKRPRSGRV